MTGILPAQDIETLLNSTSPPILDGEAEQIRSASYDLRLGKDFYLYDDSCSITDQTKISHLIEGSCESIVIPSNQTIMVTIHEELNLPNDIVGRLSLKVGLTSMGVMMSAQSQIDAGYNGKIYALLLNLSGSTVTIRLKESILRLELFKLSSPSTKPYINGVDRSNLSRIIEKPIFSGIGNIQKEVSKSKSIIKDLQESINKETKGRTRLTIALPFLAAIIGTAASYGVAYFKNLDQTATLTIENKKRITALISKEKKLQKSIDELLVLKEKYKQLELKLEIEGNTKKILNIEKGMEMNSTKVDSYHESPKFNK